MFSLLSFAREVHPQNIRPNFMVSLLFRASLPNSDTAAGHDRSTTIASDFLLPTLSRKVCHTKKCDVVMDECATKEQAELVMSALFRLLLKCTQAPVSRHTNSLWLCELVPQPCHTATLRIDINTARLSLQALYFTHSIFLPKLPQKSYSTM